ncbi:MAG: ABC transporter substrate-binding protein [Bacteroidales bacterium]|nr:ABC transporter substrate-binding protein [Bacteroidales bacterium]
MNRLLVIFLLFITGCLVAQTQRDQYIEHKVRWMENIYTISKKYNANPNVVLEYNRISANDVRRGIILRIPLSPEERSGIEPSDNLVETDPAHTYGSKERHLYDCMEYRPSSWTTHRASVILPFQLQNTRPNSNFLEFYQGLLLAVLDLKERGMSVELTAYDSGSSSVASLAQSGAFVGDEIVIGPVYAGDLYEVLNRTYGQNIKVISPLDPQTEQAAETNPNFFQINTSLYWQQYNLVQQLRRNSGMVWLFREESGADQELVGVIRDVLSKNQIVYREFVHKVAKDADIRGELSQLLTQRQNNQVVVASTNEAFVSDVLRNLYLVHTRSNCPITLYGNARWRNFESVDLEYYHTMNLHLSVPNYVDYQDQEVRRFLLRYRSLFRAEPTPYAYQGYDVGNYFLSALYSNGPHFECCLEQGFIPAQPLQSQFRFQRVSPDGGFVNTGSRVIRYLPDYRIEILN